MTGRTGLHYTPSHTNISKFFNFEHTFSQLILQMLKLCRVAKVKVLFLVLVHVFNCDLFEFLAAILEKGLLFYVCMLSLALHNKKDSPCNFKSKSPVSPLVIRIQSVIWNLLRQEVIQQSTHGKTIGPTGCKILNVNSLLKQIRARARL